MKQSSFSTNFCIEDSFNLDYVIHFYKPKKGFSSAIFTIKILVAETFKHKPFVRMKSYG